ncbi:MAG TPA: carbon-nitrogen hydrolase family protein [Rhodocyclaceae bacterium]
MSDIGRLRIAALQMTSTPRVADNLKIVDELAAEAAARGAQLVALPEYYPIMGSSEDAKVYAREPFAAGGNSGPIQSHLKALARRHGLWVIGGSIPLEASTPDKILNSMLVYTPTGELAARYDKIHLVGFQKGVERYDEAASIEPGHEIVAFDAPFGRVGLSICYDLRFPELYRAMGRPDLIVVPAAFTETTGRAHWEILLRARAIENQCYVLAVGQGGQHESGRMTHGNSMIIDPWGEILDRLPKGQGVVIADFDRERIREVRASLPALDHRTM